MQRERQTYRQQTENERKRKREGEKLTVNSF